MFGSSTIYDVDPDVMHEIVLHPWYKTEISRTGESDRTLVGYASK